MPNPPQWTPALWTYGSWRSPWCPCRSPSASQSLPQTAAATLGCGQTFTPLTTCYIQKISNRRLVTCLSHSKGINYSDESCFLFFNTTMGFWFSISRHVYSNCQFRTLKVHMRKRGDWMYICHYTTDLRKNVCGGLSVYSRIKDRCPEFTYIAQNHACASWRDK